MLMYCIILSSVACLALQYFSTLSHIQHYLKKMLLDIKCVFDLLHILSLQYLLFSEEVSAIRSDMYVGLHVKYPLFLSDFNKN